MPGRPLGFNGPNTNLQICALIFILNDFPGNGIFLLPYNDFGLFSVYFLCWDAKTKQFHNCLAKIMEICPQSKSTEKYLWINITKGFTTFPKGPQHQGQMAGGERVNGKHMLCFCLYKVFAFCLYKCIVQGCYWHRGTTLPMQR